MRLTLKHEKSRDELYAKEGFITFKVSSDMSERFAYIDIYVECLKDRLDVEYENREATYAPYGSTTVVYEPAGSDVTNVDASNAIVAEYDETCDEEGDQISDQKACELLKCSKDDFDRCVEKAEDIAYDIMKDFVEDYYEEHQDELEDLRQDDEY